jgi:hypothetical protein
MRRGRWKLAKVPEGMKNHTREREREMPHIHAYALATMVSMEDARASPKA